MDQKSFCLIAGVIFTMVAIVHLARLIFGLAIVIAGVAVPDWVSVVGLLVTGVLGFYGLRFGTKP